MKHSQYRYSSAIFIALQISVQGDYSLAANQQPSGRASGARSCVMCAQRGRRDENTESSGRTGHSPVEHNGKLFQQTNLLKEFSQKGIKVLRYNCPPKDY